MVFYRPPEPIEPKPVQEPMPKLMDEDLENMETMESEDDSTASLPIEVTPPTLANPVVPTRTGFGESVGRFLQNAGNAIEADSRSIQTIQTKDGPVLVETAPDFSPAKDDELADLFEVPKEDDSDMYTEDLTAPPDDEELGDLIGDEDMSDLFDLNEPLKAPPGRRIVRVIRRPGRGSQALGGMGGMR